MSEGIIDTSVLEDDVSRRAVELFRASPFTLRPGSWDDLPPDVRGYWLRKAVEEFLTPPAPARTSQPRRRWRWWR